MEITIDKISDCQVSLSATVPASDVASVKDGILSSYVKNARVPGFRPGKAPKSMIAKRYATEVTEELEYQLKSKIQDKCLDENPDLKVLDFGTPEGTMAEDGSYSVKATLTIVPDFETDIRRFSVRSFPESTTLSAAALKIFPSSRPLRFTL